MHTDQPVSTLRQDRFQRYGFAKRIASIAGMSGNNKSLVIGLYGKWGEGKSTVMEFIRKELPSDTAIINFNPWFFSSEENLLKYFFSSITVALGTAESTNKEKIGKILSEYSGAVGSITQLVGFNTTGLEKIGDKLKNTSIEKIKRRVDKLITESGKHIVVFMDDIDRLDIEEIQHVFKLVKLVGDFPETTYILSFDDEMVSAALAPKYGGAQNITGYNFLEKIIQLPIRIPKANKKALFDYTMELLKKSCLQSGIYISEIEMLQITEAFNKAFLPFIDNPRFAIRYANSVTFLLPLLSGEINNGDLIILEGLKTFYPQLYGFIRANEKLFTDRTDGEADYEYDLNVSLRKARGEKISQQFSTYSQEQSKALKELLQSLFPQLKNVFDNTSYPEKKYQKWTAEKRICSNQYFERYFTYTVQLDDIPDRKFEEFILNLANKSLTKSTKEFKKFCNRYDTYFLVQKFRVREKDLNEIQSEMLSKIIVSLGDTFPIEKDVHFATTYAQSALLVANLLANIDLTKRLALAKTLLNESQSLGYALQIYQWIFYGEENVLAPEKISENPDIKSLLIGRYQREMTKSNFFKLIPDSDLAKLLLWWTKMESEKPKLEALLNEKLSSGTNPDFALNLIKIFTPTKNSFSLKPQSEKVENIVFKAGFNLVHFKLLEEIVDPFLIERNLTQNQKLNLSPKNPSNLSEREAWDDKTLISVFQWYLHHNES